MKVYSLTTHEQIEQLAEQFPHRLIVVDFWAPWCGPCMEMKTTFSELATQHQDGIFISVNIDADVTEEIKRVYNIQSIPLFVFIKNHKVIDMMMGANKSELLNKISTPPSLNSFSFNINLFLNEKCKDALSMDEFIDKIEISMKNLLTTREKGQAEGISNIIVENMNKLSLYERPLHCTDKKRETLYIKNNEWEKDENREHINKALKKKEKKQLKNIKIWLDEHPNYMKNSYEQGEFARLLRECSNSIDDNREKIIKKICNEVYLDKE